MYKNAVELDHFTKRKKYNSSLTLMYIYIYIVPTYIIINIYCTSIALVNIEKK